MYFLTYFFYLKSNVESVFQAKAAILQSVALHNVFFFCHICLSCHSVTEAEAKDVHRSLKVAAGIFKCLKVRFTDILY